MTEICFSPWRFRQQYLLRASGRSRRGHNYNKQSPCQHCDDLEGLKEVVLTDFKRMSCIDCNTVMNGN